MNPKSERVCGGVGEEENAAPEERPPGARSGRDENGLHTSLGVSRSFILPAFILSFRAPQKRRNEWMGAHPRIFSTFWKTSATKKATCRLCRLRVAVSHRKMSSLKKKTRGSGDFLNNQRKGLSLLEWESSPRKWVAERRVYF